MGEPLVTGVPLPLCIDVQTYRDDEAMRDLADRLMAALHYDPRKVTAIRVTRYYIAVDVVERAADELRTRTHLYTIDGERSDEHSSAE